MPPSDAAARTPSFNEKVGKLTTERVQGPDVASSAAAPEAVAKRIAEGARGEAPEGRATRSRASAHLMITQRRLTPDRVWDLMMRSQFPTPKP